MNDAIHSSFLPYCLWLFATGRGVYTLWEVSACTSAPFAALRLFGLHYFALPAAKTRLPIHHYCLRLLPLLASLLHCLPVPLPPCAWFLSWHVASRRLATNYGTPVPPTSYQIAGEDVKVDVSGVRADRAAVSLIRLVERALRRRRYAAAFFSVLVRRRGPSGPTLSAVAGPAVDAALLLHCRVFCFACSPAISKCHRIGGNGKGYGVTAPALSFHRSFGRWLCHFRLPTHPALAAMYLLGVALRLTPRARLLRALACVSACSATVRMLSGCSSQFSCLTFLPSPCQRMLSAGVYGT